MGIIRSYFSKNNTLIEGNHSNNSQNPVTEISYGTLDNLKTRYVFDVNMDRLIGDINSGLITQNNVVKHTLKMVNTISYAPQYIGKKSYSSFIDRASGFELELFNISEDWDEGSGYDFIYDDFLVKDINIKASNWYERKENIPWLYDGGYSSGATSIINTQYFQNGSESLEIDVTDYVNQRLGFSGETSYTGDSYGIGIKFTDHFESLDSTSRKAVAFHAKNTNTWYEPYIETVIDDTIVDDRNYFYLDRKNKLYFYINYKNDDIITVNSVKIYDYKNKHIDTLSGDSIAFVKKGVYSIDYTVLSEEYPDAVLFKDEWDFTINGFSKKHKDMFYLIPDNIIYDGDTINFNNYFFSFSGILQGEKLQANSKRKIKLHIKEFYETQNKNKPLNLEYRIYTIIGKNHQIDVIPFSNVDRTKYGFELTLDTSWLIPQDYYLELRLTDGEYSNTKECLKFTIVSNHIFK